MGSGKVIDIRSPVVVSIAVIFMEFSHGSCFWQKGWDTADSVNSKLSVVTRNGLLLERRLGLQVNVPAVLSNTVQHSPAGLQLSRSCLNRLQRGFSRMPVGR